MTDEERPPPRKCQVFEGIPLLCDFLHRRLRKTAPTSPRACGVWYAFGWIEGQTSGRPTVHGVLVRERSDVQACFLNYCPFCGGPLRVK